VNICYHKIAADEVGLQGVSGAAPAEVAANAGALLTL